MPEAFHILRVPASSANLGPGFDTLGLALDVYLRCRFRRASELTIRVSGRDAGEISTGNDNLIWQTAHQIAPQGGPIELVIDNDIPLGKGMGSSAAAITAGVIIGAELAGFQWDRVRVFDEVARIEGHPDNAGACVFGGVVATAMVSTPIETAAGDGQAAARAIRLEFPPRFGVAVIVPDFPVPTSEARRVLPHSYSREDAIFNLQRTALLVAALATGTSEAFSTALEDRLHQPYRFDLVPGLDKITRLRAPGLLGCALSGAGPSILVFYETGSEEVCDLARQVFAAHGRASEILWTHVAASGYELS